MCSLNYCNTAWKCRVSSLLSPVGVYSEWSAVCRQEEGLHRAPACWHCDLGFPVSRPVSNKFLLFISQAKQNKKQTKNSVLKTSCHRKGVKCLFSEMRDDGSCEVRFYTIYSLPGHIREKGARTSTGLVT